MKLNAKNCALALLRPNVCNSGLLFVLRWRPGIDLAQQDSVTLFFIRSSTVVLELHNSPEEEQG